MTNDLPPIRFGTDGWRAAIADEFTFAAVRRVAAGVADYVRDDPGRPDVVVVGYDRRFASEGFAAAAAAVLASRGIEVVLSDRPVPTQLCSFTAHRRGCMALVVTASHN
ncbi:MAG TPA: phosphoglucomutase/phosphomannomutase family protein, partial [Pilimelia sp.]|nr:phosphoglucomutase/phosphomannomutase family protein [Pilimelia sp.]